MKLRNKQTGEIATLTLSTNGEDMIIMGNDMLAHITKLSELNDYEDYEEPKEYWFINSVGGVIRPSDTTDWEQQDATHHKEIGNYFSSQEEAEKAVEKLKAWKRLKDNGFRFIGLGNDRYGVKDIKYRIDPPTGFEENEDLHLLFGGEE